MSRFFLDFLTYEYLFLSVESWLWYQVLGHPELIQICIDYGLSWIPDLPTLISCLFSMKKIVLQSENSEEFILNLKLFIYHFN